MAFLALVWLQVAISQEFMPLWPKTIPNQKGQSGTEQMEDRGLQWVTNVQVPGIEVYLPAKNAANGQAVVIFPGGGYTGLAYDWEGTLFAKFLSSQGIAGIVVKYRLPISKSLTDQRVVPLQDAQRAIRMVRAKAADWNIDADKIGIMGFSAGGHLASTLGTHYDQQVYTPQDAVDEQSARPDFMALIYPVITMDATFTHMGSRNSLLGMSPSDTDVALYSNEKQVTDQTPPTFLIHAQDDDVVPIKNSLVFYDALLKHKVAASMHLYPTGGHGFSLALNNPYLKGWTQELLAWLATLN